MMPMFDRRCDCGWQKVDCWEPVTFSLDCPTCGKATERVWLASGRSPTVIDDSIPGGKWIENLGNKWQKFYSKSDIAKAAKKAGLQPFVRHVGEKGSDRSRHTTSWDSGPPPGYDPRPMCMLTPDEQRARRKEQA